MATVIRRKVKKLLETDDLPISVTVHLAEGNVVFTKQEVHRYTLLHTILDSDNDGLIGGSEGAAFLRRSGLDDDALKEVWRLASGGTSKASLTKDDFFLACKLVAIAQTHDAPSLAPAISGDLLPIADFHYGLTPDASVGGFTEAPLTHDQIKTVVSRPTVYGGTMDKHIRYNVLTTVHMANFPRNSYSVWRRFSDFEWLHKRLSAIFPAAILPIFPEKRIVNNTDDAFIKERTRQLDVYLDKVTRHPRVAESLDLLIFLDASDEGLEAAKRLIELEISESKDSVLARGVDFMINLASTGQAVPPLVFKVDDEFATSCARHGTSLIRLKSAYDTASVLHNSQIGATVNMIDFGKALTALAELEARNNNMLKRTIANVTNAENASRRAEAALLGIEPPPESDDVDVPESEELKTGSSDPAAESAFNAHLDAAKEANEANSIADMFDAEAKADPYSIHAPITPTVNESIRSNNPLYDILASTGGCIMDAGARLKEQVSELEKGLLTTLREEKEKEAEIGEAIKRRDVAMDIAQDANALLQRRIKAVAGIKPSDKNYGPKIAEAQALRDKADEALQSRLAELEKMTDVLKIEMNKIDQARRIALANAIAAHANTQIVHAKSRAEAWRAFLPSITTDPAAIEASVESINVIAKHAEEKIQRLEATEIDEVPASAAAFHGASTTSQDTDASPFQDSNEYGGSSSSDAGDSTKSMEVNAFAIDESDAESAAEDSDNDDEGDEEVATI